MKFIKIINIGFLTLLCHNNYCQSFTFHGGIKPNNLLGSHFSLKADIIKNKKSLFSANYSFVKYVDSYAKPNITQPNFHIENKRDKTLLDFPQLNRGFPVQKNDRDFRPSSLNHRFSLYYGYELLSNKSLLICGSLGPHVSFSRTIQYYIAYDFANVIINEGDVVKVVPYHDYQIYRFWDIGIGARIDISYKVFENVDLGISGQIYNDMIGGAIDLIIGGGLTYHFTNSLN